MATFKVAWNPTTRVAQVLLNATAIPGGSTNIGSFVHNDDANDALDTKENHVYFHHVRDLLYKLNPSQQDMQRLKITTGAGVPVS